jgi:hypothetical protein
MKSTVFWGITPCSPLKVNGRFGGKYRLHPQGLLATYFQAGFLLGLFFAPEEAICSSETSVDFQRTARRYIPEDTDKSDDSQISKDTDDAIQDEPLLDPAPHRTWQQGTAMSA